MGIDRILIADPDFKFLLNLKEGLLQFGQFKILTAHNGRQALDILNKNEISILVTDIFMPEIDGLELLATVTRKFPNVLIIVTTALDEDKALKKQIAGDSLFSYLLKPYDHIRLHTELIRVLDCLDEIYFKPGLYLSSILPLVYLARKTGLLVITTEGSKTGSFSFNKGLLFDASYQDLRGKDAINEMLKWGPGIYTFKRIPKSVNLSEVNGSLTTIILEGTGLKLPDAEPSRNIQVEFQDLPDLTSKPVAKLSPKSRHTSEQDDLLDKLILEAQGKIPKKSAKKESKKESTGTTKTTKTEKKGTASSTRDSGKAEHVPSDSRCRVLVVDDSKMIRKGLFKILSSDADLEIVGEAANGKEALDLIRKHKPDVVTLDINMPVMDGLSTLKHMMIQCPTPTVMLSTLTHEGTSVTFDTLKYGAVDFMPKPSSLIGDDIQTQAYEIINKIHLAAGVKIESVKYIRSILTEKNETDQQHIQCSRVVCIGAAEGGYGALLKIIPKLSTELPVAHIVIIHANPQHVDAFVNYLSRHSPMRIERASDGLIMEGATCYLASGWEDISILTQNNGTYTLNVSLSSSRPDRTAINNLMCSLAELFKEKSIGVVLSGAGTDGATGLLEIKKAGGTSIVQNPANCLYKEMSEQAMKHVERGKILPESKISETLNKLCLH